MIKAIKSCFGINARRTPHTNNRQEPRQHAHVSRHHPLNGALKTSYVGKKVVILKSTSSMEFSSLSAQIENLVEFNGE